MTHPDIPGIGGRDGFGWKPVTDWDAAYSNTGAIPGGMDYPARWVAQAAAFRASARMEADIAYGDTPRERLDLFLPEGRPKGLAIIVHGGFWLAFDKSVWSHLAAGPLARGWAVAMPSYTLAPEARISRITAEVGRAIACSAARVEGPIRLTGHSAGGHLVSRMVCEDGPLPEDVLARLERVISVSGLHDLRPLMNCEMNTGLKLDLAEATAESAALHRPVPGKQITAWVGGDELPEFLRQNDLLASVWTGLGAAVTCHHEPGRHHFDVIADLTDADAPLTRALLG
ncbi:alpha/beta hydrolase (plasmid) [Paroceanicella profunda]|uniref:Alpha/beta hydrolase n=1 Tax=Paroceanicella profunda TaxID=2579971 RepID=A0A5B8G4R4_9RHOB|nr:alpha/beta hydrolase [Paroceanicella profunda]QDL93963.1 alpha/beta hydrolase [Paroceanicella profunda]